MLSTKRERREKEIFDGANERTSSAIRASLPEQETLRNGK